GAKSSASRLPDPDRDVNRVNCHEVVRGLIVGPMAEPPPSVPGQLTPDQSQRAELWLRTHWSHSACPFHGPTRWEVGNVLAQAMAFSGGGLVVGGPVYPLVVVTCATCGYTVFVNAIKVGIVQAEPAAA